MAVANIEDVRVQASLDWFLAANAETARSRANYRNDIEKRKAELMRHPVPPRDAFAYLGSFLGGIPLFTVSVRALFEGPTMDSGKVGFIILIFVVAAAASAAGYFSGRLVGPLVMTIERLRWSAMLPLLPIVGFAWGAVAGAGGGLLAFGVGAIFGLIIGGMVGALSVPLFIIVHRLVRLGDSIELKHFLPLSLGIVMVLCAFILGL